MVAMILDEGSDKCAKLRAKLCTYLKRAYDARNDGMVTRHAIEPMVEMFEQINSDSEKRALLDELKFRIDLLIVSAGNVRTSRCRCMKAIVGFGVAVRNKTNDGVVLNFLVDYCNKFAEANADVMRAAVCLLIALLFEATTDPKYDEIVTTNRRRREERVSPQRLTSRSDSDQFNASIHLTRCTLPANHYQTLFNVLKHRRRDVSHDVRIPAIRALAAVQDAEIDVEHTEAIKETPKEMLMKAFSDPDKECRMEALSKLTVCSPAHIQLVLNTAVNDEHPMVRRAALEKIVAENRDFHSLKTRDRVTLLKNLVHGSNYAQFKEVTDQLVSLWITDYMQQHSQPTATIRKKKSVFNHKHFFNALAMLISELDPVRNEQLCEEIFVVAIVGLAVERRKMELTDFVGAIVNESDGSAQAEELGYLYRANFRQKLFLPGYVADKANLLFLWRCLLQLCACRYGKTETEAKLADCRFKLVPTMTEYALLVSDFLHHGLGSVEVARDVLTTPARPTFQCAPPATPLGTLSVRKRRADTEQYEEQLIHYAMRQLFNIFPLLEMDDIGKSHWHELAFSVLANPTVTLREQFLQELVEQLMFYHYPEEEQIEQAIRCFCDAINNIVTRNVQTDQQSFDRQLRSPSFSSNSSRESLQQNPIAKLDDPIRIRCLSIFTTMLRSGRFLRSNVELDGLYEALITRASLAATSADERTMAYQCLTWRCLLCETETATFMPIIWHALELHQGRGLLPYLDMIGDLVRFYGYTKMANWYVKSLDEVRVVEDSFVVEEEEERAVAEGRATQRTVSSASEENDDEGMDMKEEEEIVPDEQHLELLNKYIYYARQAQMEPQVVFRATEHLCGWLLCGGLRIGSEESVKALAHLLLVMFNSKSRDRVPEANVCLSRFLNCFVSVSRRHQQLLIRAFMTAFSLLQSMSLALQEEARDIDTVKMATSVQQFTSVSMLTECAVERHRGTVQSEFAQRVLEMVRDNPDELFGMYDLFDGEKQKMDPLAAIYLRLLPNFDPVEQRETLQELLFLCTDTIKHFEDLHEGASAGKLSNLRSYLRILTRRADVLRA